MNLERILVTVKILILPVTKEKEYCRVKIFHVECWLSQKLSYFFTNSRSVIPVSLIGCQKRKRYFGCWYHVTLSKFLHLLCSVTFVFYSVDLGWLIRLKVFSKNLENKLKIQQGTSPYKKSLLHVFLFMQTYITIVDFLCKSFDPLLSQDDSFY